MNEFSTDADRYEKIFEELKEIYADEDFNDEEHDEFATAFLSFAPILIPGLIKALPSKKIMNQIILDLKNYTDKKKDDGNAGFGGAKEIIDEFAGFICDTEQNFISRRNFYGNQFEKGTES